MSSKVTALTNITGAALVDADEFYVVDQNGAAGSPASRAITLAELKTILGYPSTLIINDEKTLSTGGGAASPAGTFTRDLNTIKVNEITGASLSINQVTLPAGNYEIVAAAPARKVNNHRLYWRRASDDVTFVTGSSALSLATLDEQNNAQLIGRFTIGVSTAFELQHNINTANTATTALGSTAGAEGPEIYAQVIIRKLP